MLDTRGARLTTILVLLAVLCTLFVWYGTLTPAPHLHAYPGEDELATDYDSYIGQHVTVSGSISATHPVTIEVKTDIGIHAYVLANAPDVEAGQEIRLFATVEPDGTLQVENAIVRDTWEGTYMYAVSLIGAVWLCGRSIRHWRVDHHRFALVPRTAARADREPDPSGGERRG